MKKEKESASIPSENSDLCSTTEMTGVSAPSVYRAANGATIDFHSAEFNRTDDLNDCSGNYRFFEPLDGIITADMRHQMGRLREEGCIDSSVDEAVTSNGKQIEIESDEPEPVEHLPPLTVVSQGRTLIIDTDADRAVACGKILTDQLLTCTLVVTEKTSKDASFPRLSRPALLEADRISITGAFGGFSATVTAKGDQTYLTEGFDLVLDLQPTPSFSGDSLPMGYYVPGQNPEDLNEVLAELPEMRGRFEKPQFMIFQKSRCLHGRRARATVAGAWRFVPLVRSRRMGGKFPSIITYVRDAAAVPWSALRTRFVWCTLLRWNFSIPCSAPLRTARQTLFSPTP